ncbi:MAG: hypothetical protein HKO08_09025 [Erythrobacter sp.]|nr:hypothetical protein [Erythrobacter sp.]
MRKILPITLMAAAASLAANAAIAQADAAPIASDSVGALEAPEDWDCERYEEEWREWIDEGNSPDAWRFAGKRYRAVSDGDLYTWEDWLDWSDESGCLAGAYVMPEDSGVVGVAFGGLTAVMAVFGTSATGLIAASGGENSQSPG